MKHLTVLLLLLTGIAFGQSSEETRKRTASEEAFLDTAVKLEKIKIAFAHLTTSYELKSKESSERNDALCECELQKTMQKRQFEKQLADKPKQPGKWKTFWRGFQIGFGTAAVVTVTLIAL